MKLPLNSKNSQFNMNNLNFIKKIYRPYGYKINTEMLILWADKNENYDSIQSRYLKNIKKYNINAVRYYLI